MGVSAKGRLRALRLRALREQVRNRDYCVVVTPDDGGGFQARAYAIGDHTRDFAELAPTEVEALEQVVRRLEPDGRPVEPCAPADHRTPPLSGHS